MILHYTQKDKIMVCLHVITLIVVMFILGNSMLMINARNFQKRPVLKRSLHDRAGHQTNYSRSRQNQYCSPILTISSDGPTCWVQGNVLGTYHMVSESVMQWPTWRKSDERFLYRCPCANGKDWLFGKSNGAEVGWIKHRNCTGCPESCSRDWLYWNNDEQQWHLDKQVRITTDVTNVTCSDGNNGNTPNDSISTGIVITIVTVFCTALVSILCVWCCRGDEEGSGSGASGGFGGGGGLIGGFGGGGGCGGGGGGGGGGG